MSGLTTAPACRAAFRDGDQGVVLDDRVLRLFGCARRLLVSAAVVDESNNGGLGAKQAWLYATILTVGYMVSRGLAKSGSAQPYDEDRS